MFAHNLVADCYSSTAYRKSATHDRSSIAHGKRYGENVSHATVTALPPVNDLMVVLSATEPHRDVAMRAQLVARDTAVSRTVLFTPPLAKWQRLAQTVSTLGKRVAGIGTDVSARILRASFPADRMRVVTHIPGRDLVRRDDANLAVVGRRNTFPWLFAPLARYARQLLRRSRTPVLVVGSHPKGEYRNVVIATDLETDVGPALKWVRHVAPRASLTFVYAYRGLFESKLQWAGVPTADIRAHSEDARRTAAAGMTALLDRHRSVQRGVLAHGWPVPGVIRKARELDADLIVVVKSTHSWWAEMLGASVSFEVAAIADRDVLVVHGVSSRPLAAGSDHMEASTP